MSRDHRIECEVCGAWHGGMDNAPCDCEMWAVSLAQCISTAALEEARVQAAMKRVSERWGRVLGAARMHMPIGGSR
jgi:hypothetical protein